MSLLRLVLRTITTAMRTDLRRLIFFRQIIAERQKSMRPPGRSSWSGRFEKPSPSSDVQLGCQIPWRMASIHPFPAGVYPPLLEGALLAGFRAVTSVANAVHLKNLRILLALSFIPFVVK
jgi:hypothetical protein